MLQGGKQTAAQHTAAASRATLVRPASLPGLQRFPLQQQQQQQPGGTGPQQLSDAAAAAATRRQPLLHARPLRGGQHVQQLTALLGACDSTAQLAGVLRGHLPHMPPACMAAAMQQLQRLRQSQATAVADDHQLQIAGQLTTVLLRQLPLVPAGCLGSFLAAAAGMRLVVPPAVLQQLATHLVHNALRQACHERQQQQLLQQDKHHQQQHSSAAASEQQAQPRHVLAVAVWALAKLRLRDAALWEELGSLAGEQVATLAPQDCVLLAWGFAKAGHHPPRLLHALQAQLRPQVWCLAPDQIACLLWSYATAQHYHHGWVSALVGGAADSMERFSARSLATALWACARMRHADGRMLSAARVQALACISECGSQGTANLAWALASLGVVDQALTAAVLGRATQLVDAFTLQGLSNTAWAVTRLSTQQAGGSWSSRSSSRGALQQQAATFLTAACSAAVPLLHTAKPQEVCNLLWACATLKQPHASFLAAAAGRLAVLAEAASPVDLAQAVWALEVLRFRRKAVQQALVRSALNKLHNFGPQALSNVAWAVASSGMRPPPGFAAAVAQQLQLLLPQMTPQGVATTLWALSKLGDVPRQLVHAASAYVLASLHQYSPQDLCNLALVASKAGYREPALLHGLARAACSAAAAASAAAHVSFAPQQQQQPQPQHQEQQSWWHAGPTSTLGGSQPVPAPAGGRGQHIKLLTSQGVCNLVWAFAGLGWHDVALMQQLQAVAASQLGTMQPRHVAGLCQGFGLLLEPFDGLLAALYLSGSSSRQQNLEAGGQHRDAGSDSDSPDLLQHMQVWAHALRTWPADSLALLVPAVAVTQGARCSSRDAALLLTALQLLSRDGMAASLSQARQQQLHHALTLLAVQWGLADAGHVGKHSSSRTCAAQTSPMHELVSAMLPGALGCTSNTHQQQPDADELRSPGRGQLVVLAGAALHHKLIRACAGSWMEAERSRQPPHVEGEVVAALQRLGTQPLTQHWLQLAPALSGGVPACAFSSRCGSPVQPWNAMVVRLGLPGGGPGSPPVALEVLPRAALSSSVPRRPLGVTALQHACLAAAGWRVVCIAAEEWEALGSDRQRQAELLRLRLAS